MEQIDWIKEEEKKIEILKDLATWLDNIREEPMPRWIEKGFLKPKLYSSDEARVYRRLMKKHGRR